MLSVAAILPLIAASEESQLWSLQPLQNATVPEVQDESWPLQQLDYFVLARLETEGLQPAAAATPETLVRRLSFNLRGLPPTPDEIDKFLADYQDDSETAVQTTVAVWLNSPQFGEKWARHWLDLARYADSNGKDRDVVYPDAWRYRDYVIDSFNSDKPINEFFREQIAGDLLPGAGDEQRIASAFLAIGPKAYEEPKVDKFRMDMVDEQIDVLTRAMLSLTVACARCHDHKSDPVSTRDYYAMAGILLSSDTRYGPGPLYFSMQNKNTELVPVGDRVDELHPAVAAWRQEIHDKTQRVITLRGKAYGIYNRLSGLIRARGLESAEDDPELAAMEARRLEMIDEAKQLDEERVQQIHNPPAEQPGYTMAVLRSPEAPIDCALRIRGEYNEIGRVVPRSEFEIPGTPALAEIPDGEDGRLELANWIASDEHPLTARVWVNRVWFHLFGAGLVRTVDNFGVTGEAPSHPELLDFLTAEFIADGWSTKNLVGRILRSRTWQLASDTTLTSTEKDPENRLLWRANFRRLDIEAFRDSVLFVSGELVFDPMPGSHLMNAYAGMDIGESSNHNLNVDEEIAADRHRSVYLPLTRNRMPEFLRLFDFADINASTAMRNNRTIPAQALYLMNNEFMEGRAAAAADRMLELPAETRIESAWRIATGRTPEPDFAAELSAWLDQRARQSSEHEAWINFMQMTFSTAHFRYIE